ncbi:MAG: hypothetical protein NWF10_03620 [Candidatus Bathyarchaeota archaeon]|nr:hypothetical protein [Candidatus Bathyarchaeota archaeon]
MEKKYKWLEAADFYEKALDLALKMEDFLKTAKLSEQLAFCFFRAALQAQTNEEFKRRMKLTIRTYEKAVKLFEMVEKDGKRAKINHSKAMVAYSSFWLAKNPSKKKDLLDEWWKLEIEALKDYEEAGDHLSVGRICNNLSEGSAQRINFASDWLKLEKRIEEGFSYGEKAIMVLAKVGEEHELATAYCWTSFCYVVALWYRVMEDRRGEFGKKCLNYSRKALTLSKKTGDAYLIGHSNMSAGLAEWGFVGNPFSALDFFKEARKHGVIAKDNFLIGIASVWMTFNNNHVMNLEEDPDKQREGFKKSKKFAQDAIHHFRIVVGYPYFPFAYDVYSRSIMSLALIETNPVVKSNLLEKAVKVARKGLEDSERWVYTNPSIMILEVLTFFVVVLYRLSEMEMKINEKKQLLEEASKYTEKEFNIRQRLSPFDYWNNSHNLKNRALIQAKLAKIETKQERKQKLLQKAVSAMEECLKLVEKDIKDIPPGWKNRYVGSYYCWYGGTLEQLYLLTKDKKILNRAIEVYQNAIETYSKVELKTREAESHWQIAKLQNLLGDNLEAARNYESAAENYKLAAEKIPQLKEFYQDYSDYMQAWSQIEQARHNHSIEEYEKAKEYYEKAARLHETCEPWSYLASNYLAWSIVEEAEGLSRKENTQQAKEAFQRAYQHFGESEKSIKQKIKEITSIDEKEMTQRLLKTSDLRSKYCQARVLLEEAKLLDRKGKYLQSSKNYGKAAEKIESIIEQIDTESERKELKIIAVLCRAWQKMANAEETTSSQAYLEAAQLFDQAKELSVTKKTSLWALGNSSFCRGLAAENKFQNTLEKSFNSKANKYMKNASSYYKEAGFHNAYEFAKATQRLFDAYLYMNSAEDEVDPEKKTKFYQLSEQLLQIAAGSFIKAKQPEKTSEVQRILSTVREEKALATSLNQVMRAPSIASSTLSFVAPTPTSEVSAGLEQFEHANIQANLVTHVKQVKVRESFCLSVEFVNAGKEPALLTRIEELIPRDFVVVKKPEIYRLEDTCLNMKGKQLAPLKLVEAKLVLQPSRKGVYQLKPKVHYLNEIGQKKSLILKSIEIKVEEVVLADRVSTGTKELDSLLLGGIPENYAIVLTGPPNDEREQIIKNFLKAGTKQNQPTFYVTTQATSPNNLLEKSSLHLFLCNPKPKTQVPNRPNITKLKGKTNLTNLNIALFKTYRNITSNKLRICNEIVSDVLLDYGAKTTRKWIAEMITDLTSKGFTILAVINPLMHTSEELNVVLDLFDGEIRITQTKDALECKKFIQVEKLRNQDYIKNPICLTKQA